jgi:hypothetical protein
MQNRLSIGLLVATTFLAGAAVALEGARMALPPSQTAPVVVMLRPEIGPVVRGHGWTLTLPPANTGSEDGSACVRDGYDSCSDGDADSGGSDEDYSKAPSDTDPI